MKRIIAILLVLCMVVSLAACGGEKTDNTDNSESTGGTTNNQPSGVDADKGDDKNTDGKKEDTTVENNNEVTKAEEGTVVICIGDSITEGMGMATEHRYPSVLGKHLEGQYKVLNAGVGGEQTYAIMSRLNAIDFTVSKQIVFGKGETELEYDWKIFSGMNGEEIKYRYGVMGRDLKINNLTIDGKPYTLRFEKGESEEQGKYILGREDASAIAKIPVGAKIKFDYSGIYKKNYCTVLLMGANGGWGDDINTLISQYKKIAAQTENFIAIIPHYGKDYTKEFEAAFGNKCVSLRGYANGSLFKDYDLEFTQVDKIDLEEGRLPRIFNWKRNKSDCHLNELGYKILGDLVYKKGVELGYWK